MLSPSIILSLLPLFLSSVHATPLGAPVAALKSRDSSGPSITAIFFSDNNCTTTVPSTIYTRKIYGADNCHFDADEVYNSLEIIEIDDQFIGTNTALQVGNSGEGACNDFERSEKFSIATRDDVGKCLFVGITGGMGKPLVGGNEYRLTTLQ